MNYNIKIEITHLQGNDTTTVVSKNGVFEVGSSKDYPECFGNFPWRLIVMPSIWLLSLIMGFGVMAMLRRNSGLSFSANKGEYYIEMVNALPDSIWLVMLGASMFCVAIFFCAIIWAYRIWSENQRKILKAKWDRERFYVEKAVKMEYKLEQRKEE